MNTKCSTILAQDAMLSQLRTQKPLLQHSHSSPEVPGTAEMARGLRTLALAEDSGLLPSIHAMHIQTCKQTMSNHVQDKEHSVKPRRHLPIFYTFSQMSSKP